MGSQATKTFFFRSNFLSSKSEKLTKYGFIEKYVDLSESTDCTETEKSDEFWREKISNQLSEFCKSPFEQLRMINHNGKTLKMNIN